MPDWYKSNLMNVCLDSCRNGVKLARKIAATSSLQAITDHELHPGTKIQVPFVRRLTRSSTSLCNPF